MEGTSRKRGRPRIPVTEDVIESRRLAKQRYNQRYNARRAEGTTSHGPSTETTVHFTGTTSHGPSMETTVDAASIPLRRRGGVSAAESPRRRGSIDKKKTNFGEYINFLSTTNIILDIGAQDQVCGYCGALVWAAEFTGRHVGPGPKAYSICCAKGKEAIDHRLNFPRSGDKLDPDIVNLILQMLTRDNVLVGIYKQLRERYHVAQQIPVCLRLLERRSTDGRFVNLLGINDYEFAGLAVDEDLSNRKDILVHYKQRGLERITELHPCFMSLQYPLLFPRGEDGFRLGIKYRGATNAGKDDENTVSMREFQTFRLQYRSSEGHTLLLGGRLFLQYVVDAWCCIERGRLKWVELHQSIIRSELYNNLVDSFSRGDVSAADVGKRIVLPSSFTGGFRYMQQNYQDSLALCKEYGHPDLFVTFTCNPQWVEIQRALANTGCRDASVRPDLVARVFKLKLDAMMSDFMKKDVLGRVLAAVYTIEFQKRGLPHAHIVLWLADGDKIMSTDEIDSVISAELPDKETDKVAYEAVAQFMMHGPCGEANPRCPCMANGKCTKYYPRPYTSSTTIDSNGYATYRRRDTGQTVEVNKIHLDNRHVVPYNRGLLVKYQAHINVERCNRSQSIKYLFKQTLPVVPKAGREGIVAASISKSYLWRECKVFTLLENMRVDKDVPPITVDGEVVNFKDWMLRLGNGVQQTYDLGDGTDSSWINIPKEVQVTYSGDPVKAIVDEIYRDLNKNHGSLEYLRDRAILTPLNEYVDKINREVLDRLPGESRVYKSSDTICKGSSTNASDEVLYPPEYLNSLKFSAEGVEDGLKSFSERGISPRFLIIDDGWQQFGTDNKGSDCVVQEGARFANRLTGMRENVKFQNKEKTDNQPPGLQILVNDVKKHHSVKASDDFYPRDPASHTINILSVAYNTLFFGEFMQPDWDMFHSLHPAADYHAAARSVGGCPIYVSDKPGNHNFDILRKLVLHDGSVLRAQLPGRLTRDCLFTDPARDGKSLLKIWNVNKCSGVVGVLNCQGAGWCKDVKKTRTLSIPVPEQEMYR
ncbi:hypothetical protein POM88_002084 [Heracleum sosnowskyi]|uniref:ATP-dependent DNA helicase n=1 Tax=Heracleum sosnowskyi TaxID=360622 RepID=A0AAD8JFH2_9APIA|nr:hypothetical protein POM88_002084 [Heracleum sosnowskyi]